MKKYTIFTIAFLIISTLSFAQYTLQDADVVVTNGVIISCSITNFNTSSYSNGNIIIPQVLDGDTVKGVADGTLGNGVFKLRNISSLTLPPSIQNIGDLSFASNSISSLDLSACTALQYVGSSAFQFNNISNLDLSICTALKSIGNYAFYYNSISSLDLGGCTTLQYIGDYAFNGNAIASLDLSSCTALKSIGSRAFYGNSINYLNLNSCTALISIKDFAFYGNSLNNLDLSTCTALQYIKQSAFRNNSIDTLNLTTCNSLISIGNNAFNSNSISNLNLSSCNALQSIGEYAFYNNAINNLNFNSCTALISIGENAFQSNYISNLDLSFCTALQTIERYAFENNTILNVDLSTCSSLQTIKEYAFENNTISTLDLSACSSLQTIGDEAFYNNTISSLDLSACTSLIYIGQRAFYNNSIVNLNLSASSALQTIGANAFYNNSISSLNLSACSALQSIGNNAFKSNFIDTIDLSLCTVLRGIGYYAFYDNYISSFKLPIPNKIAYNFTHWRNSNYDTLNGGEIVTDLSTYYYAYFTPTGSHVSFNVRDSTINHIVQNAVVDLGIYGTQSTNINGTATFYSVNDTIDLPYTISKDGYTINGNITIASSPITEDVLLFQLYTYNDTLVLCNSELPYLYNGKYIYYGTTTGYITYTYTSINGSDSTVPLYVIINPVPEVVCPNDINTTSTDIISLNSATPQNGIYTGIAVSNNQFNPAGLANGAYTITYSYQDPVNLCYAFCEFDINLGIVGIKNSENNINCNIYPNPTSGACTLNLSLNESQEVILRLINNLGQEIESRKLNPSKEFNETFDFSGMAPGVYSILINVDGKLITKKVVLN